VLFCLKSAEDPEDIHVLLVRMSRKAAEVTCQVATAVHVPVDNFTIWKIIDSGARRRPIAVHSCSAETLNTARPLSACSELGIGGASLGPEQSKANKMHALSVGGAGA
jgi:hypothetical protein